MQFKHSGLLNIIFSVPHRKATVDNAVRLITCGHWITKHALTIQREPWTAQFQQTVWPFSLSIRKRICLFYIGSYLCTALTLYFSVSLQVSKEAACYGRVDRASGMSSVTHMFDFAY